MILALQKSLKISHKELRKGIKKGIFLKGWNVRSIYQLLFGPLSVAHVAARGFCVGVAPPVWLVDFDISADPYLGHINPQPMS